VKIYADRPEFTKSWNEMDKKWMLDWQTPFKRDKGIRSGQIPPYDLQKCSEGLEQTRRRFRMQFGELNEVAQNKRVSLFLIHWISGGIAVLAEQPTLKKIDTYWLWVNVTQVRASEWYAAGNTNRNVPSSVDGVRSNPFQQTAEDASEAEYDLRFVRSTNKTRTQCTLLK
jgi:hypothetical protein